MRAQHYESGQAIVEMFVGIIAIIFVISGLIIVAVLGNETLGAMNEARNQAALQLAANDMQGGDGVAINSANVDATIFSNQLLTTNGEVDARTSFNYQYVLNNEFDSLVPSDDFFLRLARLNRFSHTSYDVLRDLDDLVSGRTVTIVEDLYMPDTN